MRQVMPPITEPADDLQQRFQCEQAGHKKPQLQMLYLLVGGLDALPDICRVAFAPLVHGKRQLIQLPICGCGSLHRLPPGHLVEPEPGLVGKALKEMLNQLFGRLDAHPCWWILEQDSPSCAGQAQACFAHSLAESFA